MARARGVKFFSSSSSSCTSSLRPCAPLHEAFFEGDIPRWRNERLGRLLAMRLAISMNEAVQSDGLVPSFPPGRGNWKLLEQCAISTPRFPIGSSSIQRR